MGASNAKVQALHAAVLEDDAEKVREILEQNGLDPNTRGENDLTALHVAILQGALKSTQVLLDCQRMDFTSLTPEGQTPLLLAAAKAQEDIALYLLETLPEEHSLYTEDKKGFSVVHYACSSGLQRLLRVLLDRGVDAEVRGGKLKHTPLMLAAQNGHLETIKMLLEAGVSISAVDTARMTALHHACMADAEECVKALLEIPGIAIDSKDVGGCTPLLYCVNNKNKSLEKLLVGLGASLITALDAGFSKICYHTLQD